MCGGSRSWTRFVPAVSGNRWGWRPDVRCGFLSGAALERPVTRKNRRHEDPDPEPVTEVSTVVEPLWITIGQE